MSLKKNINTLLTKSQISTSQTNVWNENFEFNSIIVDDDILFYYTPSLAKCYFRYGPEAYMMRNGVHFEISDSTFNKNVTININAAQDNIVFTNCIFKKDVIIQSTNSTKSNSFIISGGSINHLKVENVSAVFKFYINPQEKKYVGSISINKLTIIDSHFFENFKLHHAKVSTVSIEDVDFHKNADFYKSIFHKGVMTDDIDVNAKKDDIGFNAINFKGLALFGDTMFEKKLIFKHVTFESHNHFKSAQLNEGLDLEYTNIQKEINFYGIDIKDIKNTSQETYRIIKHQFEKLGNRIEANKYHALELMQRRRNLRKKKFESFSNFIDWIVFLLHFISSKHSTNWAYSLVWIALVGFITHYMIDNYVCYKCSNHSNWLDWFRYFSIVNLDDCIKRNPLIFIFNKTLLGYLYYQFLMSVRKDTRK